MKFLEDVGYDGPRHFDAHAYRTEDYDGVKDFARGCMRTYLISEGERARWNADAGDPGVAEGGRTSDQAAVTGRIQPRTRRAARPIVRPRGARQRRLATSGSIS